MALIIRVLLAIYASLMMLATWQTKKTNLSWLNYLTNLVAIVLLVATFNLANQENKSKLVELLNESSSNCTSSCNIFGLAKLRYSEYPVIGCFPNPSRCSWLAPARFSLAASSGAAVSYHCSYLVDSKCIEKSVGKSLLKMSTKRIKLHCYRYC
ncbi:hypothetical protein R53140_OCIKHKEL_00969 [Fructobacillus fructosus]|uniref:hypothetical protein n=1 Tax=Fructobacillus fructosus TaxID=1631 RepID=UPI002DA74F79|nr:hypothetical protein R53140_OCIKHKEL_00969 [Fructobacillus fructosus]